MINVLLSGQAPLGVHRPQGMRAIRQADHRDIKGIVDLISAYASDGTMLSKDAEAIAQQLAQFVVAVEGERVIGCASLAPFSEMGTAELGSLATDAEERGTGLGDALLQAVQSRARDLGLASIFALTTRTEQWFRFRGFTEKSPDWLPPARRHLYDWSRRSKVFCLPLS